MKPLRTHQRISLTNWLALLALLSLGIVWPPVFAAGSALSDIHAGSLLMKRSEDAEPIEAVRVSTQIRAHVTGNVARVYVTQQFSNPTSDWVEGLYVFPLSAGAAVDELEMQIGERRIRGDIRKREEARATYEQAKSEGRRASLVDQERPNMFTTSVANIGPQSSITVEIAYLDTVPYRDGRYTLNLPLAITPRYTPGSMSDPGAPPAIDDAEIEQALTAVAATPERVTSAQQAVDINVDLSPGFPLGSVQSLHHPVSTAETKAGRRITLSGKSVPADRDFELVWTPVVAPDTHAAAFAERRGEDTYVLVTLTPPEMTDAKPLPRDVLFIIDTSGSMTGPSIEQARQALQLGVSRLSPADRFNIIRFSNDASSLFPDFQQVTASSVALAGSAIRKLNADGGTEMRAALEMAFAMKASGSLRQIVFITDGSVGNEAELVRMIQRDVGEARLFTVGIGSAPNAYFMREAAAAGRGSYTFIADVQQVRERMEELFRKLEQPALVDLSLHWPGGVVPDLAAALPGELYAGDPLVISARLTKVPAGVLTLSGRTSGNAWVRQIPLTVVDQQSGIAKLWARERIGDLTRRKGLDGDGRDAEAKIVALALDHHLVTQFTSLVAVDVTPARPVGADLLQFQAPTSAPAGGAWARSTGFPGTATPAPLLLLIGALALAFSALLLLPRRRIVASI